MVVGLYRSVEQGVVRNPKTVEEIETMVKQSLKEVKNYKNPFQNKQINEKRIVIHDPAKNPFAPLYRPDKEVLFTKDKYHIIEPPRYIAPKKEEPKVLLVAAGAGGIPPSGNGGDKSPFIKDLTKYAKYSGVNNSIPSKNSNMYNKNIK